MGDFLRQTWAVAVWNARTLGGRLHATAVILVGFMAVVLVFVSVLSIRAGFEATMARTGSDDVAIVRGNVTDTLDGNMAGVIASAPGVAQGADGPLTSNAFLVTAKMPRAHGGLPAAILIRGVDARAGAIWPRMHVIHGRLFRPGLDEVIVGRQAQQLFGKLALGDTFAWNNRNWKVVGVFADDGSSHESEIWADVRQLQADYSATNKYTDIYARLTSPAVFGTFKHALENNPQLNVNVTRESTNIKASAAGLSALITDAGSLVTLLMAIGAIFGAVNIMYSGIAARHQDIATLRSLGFRRLPVLSVVLLEGMALGLAGGILGAAAAYLIFNGYPASTLGNYVLVAFNFAVTPGLMLAGILIAAAMGLVGGLFPAIQVGRMPIATALRGS